MVLRPARVGTARLPSKGSSPPRGRGVHPAHGHRTARLGTPELDPHRLFGVPRVQRGRAVDFGTVVHLGQHALGAAFYETFPPSWLDLPPVLGSTIRINCGTGAAVGPTKGPSLRDLLQIGRPGNAPENPRVAGSIPALATERRPFNVHCGRGSGTSASSGRSVPTPSSSHVRV
jgi:hypothetical protein